MFRIFSHLSFELTEEQVGQMVERLETLNLLPLNRGGESYIPVSLTAPAFIKELDLFATRVKIKAQIKVGKAIRFMKCEAYGLDNLQTAIQKQMPREPWRPPFKPVNVPVSQ